MKIIKNNTNFTPINESEDLGLGLVLSDIDDELALNFTDPNTEIQAEVTPDTPSIGINSAISTLLNSLIIDEFEAIQGYNSAILSIESDVNAEAVVKVLKDIVNEENIHVGQLQALLKTVSPNASSIDVGNDEAEEQILDDEQSVDSIFKMTDEGSLYDFSNIADEPPIAPVAPDSDVAHPFMKVESFVSPVKTLENSTMENNVESEDVCTLSDIDDEM